MKITTFPFYCDKFFLGGDFISLENYVIINDRNQILRNGNFLKMPTSLVFTTTLPAVKILSEHLFLLVNRDIISNDTSNATPNAWLINNKGEIEKAMYLGSVDRIISTQKYIICSYGEAYLDSNSPYSTNGMVVFDFDGNSIFEYGRDENENKYIPHFIYNYGFLAKDEDK